jgi:sulfate transporter 3
MEPSTSSSVNDSDFVEIQLDVHEVVPPPHMSTVQRVRTKFKETFFPDDPMRQFKGQPCNRKLILGAQYFFPILQWLPNYNFKLLKADLISGLTIASLAIPQVCPQVHSSS